MSDLPEVPVTPDKPETATQSDPAVEAARRAFADYWPDQGDFGFGYSNEGRFGIDAAREALRPIREQCEALQGFGEFLIEESSPAEAGKGAGILEAIGVLAPFVYSAEELDQ